jgi:protein-S-isoprenylcysteine O-methyltransferase Ste14
MRHAHAVVGLLWAAFILLWLILAQFNKKMSRSTPWGGPWALRFAIIVGVIMVSVRRHAAAGLISSIGRILPLHPGITMQWVGVGLCLAGFGFAIWARSHLGRNWGMPMSLRQGHELVTSGPYAYVRHPIYTGIMLAMIGSALALDLLLLLFFVLYFGYFLFSARTEEKMMLAQFPDTYPAYRRRTKMLIPFVL